VKNLIKLVVATPVVMLVGLQSASAAEWYCSILPWLCQAPGTPGGGGASVPEPATLALLATGAVVYGAKFLRRSRSK
jgi:hypothetical protein